MVFYGDDGLDELTTVATRRCYECATERCAASPSIRPSSASRVGRATRLRGGDAKTNADALRAVLDGKPGRGATSCC